VRDKFGTTNTLAEKKMKKGRPLKVSEANEEIFNGMKEKR
jgi:hypothetical protein